MKKANRPGGATRKIDATQVSSGQAGTERLSPNGTSSMMDGSGISLDKRKPVTPDEASLTAKNYRLAKELVCCILITCFVDVPQMLKNNPSVLSTYYPL